MREETKVTAAPTIAEQMGIKYREVDGLYYPVWGESNMDGFATLGKYAHRWMTVLMEHDRYLYNRYFLDGTLMQRAKAYEEHCWQLHESMVEKMQKARGWNEEAAATTKKLHMIWNIQLTVEEIVNADIYESIDYNKRMRLERAKEELAFSQTELQRTEE